MRFCVFACLLTGCFSHSLLQRASTLEPGEHRLGAAAVAGVMYDPSTMTPSGNGELTYRVGLDENVDYGVVVWGLGVRTGPKIQLFEDDSLAISTELGVQLAYASELFAAGVFANVLVGLAIDDSEIVIGANISPSYAVPTAGAGTISGPGGGHLVDAGLLLGVDLALADIFHLMPEIGVLFRTSDPTLAQANVSPIVLHAGLGGYFQWNG